MQLRLIFLFETPSSAEEAAFNQENTASFFRKANKIETQLSKTTLQPLKLTFHRFVTKKNKLSTTLDL